MIDFIKRFSLISILLAQISYSAGIAAVKQKDYHSDASASSFVFTSYRDIGRAYVFEIGNKTITKEKNGLIFILDIPTSLPKVVVNDKDIESVVKVQKEIESFSKRFPKTKSLLEPNLKIVTDFTKEYKSGKLRYDGKWMSKNDYESIIKEKKRSSEEYKEIMKKEQEIARVEEEKKQAFIDAQTEKGLAYFEGKWIAIDEAKKLKEIKRRKARVNRLVKNNSITDVRMKIYQTLSDGALIKLYSTAKTKGYVNNSNVAFLSNVDTKLLADGEIYDLDLYYCGSISYDTKKGNVNTVTEYSLSKRTAISRLERKLYSAKGNQSNAEPSNKSKDGKFTKKFGGVKSSGSGFFIGKEGHIVTNYHVTDGAKSLKIFYQNRLIDAKVVKVNKVMDLAILKADVNVIGLPISDKEAKLGEVIFAIGYPLPKIQSVGVKVTKGIISSMQGMEDNRSHYQIDAAIQPGNSGGAICNAQGQVVGVAVSKLNEVAMAAETGSITQNVNYVIKSTKLLTFIRSVEPKIDSAIVAGDEAKSIDSVSKSTIMILVY